MLEHYQREQITLAPVGLVQPQQPGRPGEKAIDEGAIDVRDGGTAIPYDEEDPFIRAEYEEILKREGVTSRMTGSLFRRK
ncbi:MAG: hypothetical protein EXR70_07085 [Deltaproteobacteria bacterium]|nr:hypothetical protein [Deltaproteobacteria bacterium]